MDTRRIVFGWFTRRTLKQEAHWTVEVHYRTLHRFEDDGLAGLVDRREDNGTPKADERCIATVHQILKKRPRHFGYRLTTWIRHLLIDLACQKTGMRVSKTMMGRVLETLLRRLIESLPADPVALWEDAADIDLNSRIGSDWMLPGTQRQVVTPGKNVKRYFAACMNAQTGRFMWVKSNRKNCTLFVAMLKKLLKAYAGKEVIHLILDNFSIHTSQQTRDWSAEHGEKIRLHFLPPHYPGDNRIERKLWREVYANITIQS